MNEFYFAVEDEIERYQHAFSDVAFVLHVAPDLYDRLSARFPLPDIHELTINDASTMVKRDDQVPPGCWELEAILPQD